MGERQDPPLCIIRELAHEESSLDKVAAQKEVLRLWRALPIQDRLNHKQATAFAGAIADTIEFDTVGDHHKIIEAWLQRDLMKTEAAVKFVDEQTAKARLQKATPSPSGPTSTSQTQRRPPVKAS